MTFIKSRALNNSLRPKTSAAGGLDVAEAVFEIFVCHFATVAEDAGREVEVLQAFAEFEILRAVPDFQQVGLGHVADEVFARGSLAGIEIMFVSVKQGQAGADFAVLSNCQTAAFDEGTLVAVLVHHAAEEFETVHAIERLCERGDGLPVDVHQRDLNQRTHLGAGGNVH